MDFASRLKTHRLERERRQREYEEAEHRRRELEAPRENAKLIATGAPSRCLVPKITANAACAT